MENPRSSCALGSAMFMIVASRTIMSCASAMTPRIIHRWSGPAGADVASALLSADSVKEGPDTASPVLSLGTMASLRRWCGSRCLYRPLTRGQRVDDFVHDV